MRNLAAALALASALAAPVAVAGGKLDLVLGRALFERFWASGAASTDAADGLGPLFNARSCAGCHNGSAHSARFTRIDGKLAGQGLVVRLGDRDGNPDPLYGHQLQNHATAGLNAEGRISLTVADPADRPPELSVELSRGDLAAATRLSFRQAPSLAGRGGLESVTDAAILTLADPEDTDGDGISGRANRVATDIGPGIGRFGWKARHASLERQVAEAFAVDLGLSSSGVPQPHGDCTERQADCLSAPTGESAAFSGQELSEEMLRLVRDFVASLAPPAPPDASAAGVFAAVGCGDCHVPELADAEGRPVRAYTDLLLHDMGAALDDGMGEPGVDPAEWRTAPLLGMAPQDGKRRYLHDGRAGSIDEAVRAHAGEAERARSAYELLSAAERAALLAFVEAL